MAHKLLSGPTGRVGLALAIAVQPAVWAAGRWGLGGHGSGLVQELDRRTLDWIAQHAGERLDAFFVAVTQLGSFLVTALLALGLALVLFRRGCKSRAWFALGAFGGAALMAQIGKFLVARPRPDAQAAAVTMPADPSFPSAHATQVTALVLVLWLVAAEAPPHRRMALALAGTTVVVLVALSRVYLRVHYPSDVLAGVLGAAAWVVGLWLLLRTRLAHAEASREAHPLRR